MTPTRWDVRKARGDLTQEQAAALVYTSVRSWYKWENGKAPMPLALWELFQIKVKDGQKDA